MFFRITKDKKNTEFDLRKYLY